MVNDLKETSVHTRFPNLGHDLVDGGRRGRLVAERREINDRDIRDLEFFWDSHFRMPRGD